MKKYPEKEKRRRLATVFRGVKNRCYNTKDPYYHRYGGRGITVCASWLDEPRAFIDWALDNGYEIGLYLDRIDNDKPYSPENCRFVTPKESSRNKDTNVLYTYRGKTKCLAEWAEHYALSPETVYGRFQRGERGTKLFRKTAPKRAPSPRTRYYEALGHRRSLQEWSDATGLNFWTLKTRICKRGWSVERAVTTPARGCLSRLDSKLG